MLLFVCTTFTASATEIGVRFGDVSGGNVAVDAVFSVANLDLVHADVSFGDGGAGVDVLWDFLYKPIDGEAFYWYLGAGPYTFLGSPFELGVAGEIGMEYRFNNIPLVIGADWRPLLRIIDNTDFDSGGFGFNVRMVF